MTRTCTLLLIGDGRDDYLERAVASLGQVGGSSIDEWWMYDDTGDEAYRRHLADRYPGWRHINGGPRQGFGGAIRSAWAQLAADCISDWVLHWEQDFVANHRIDFLGDMADVMRDRPYLVQMALRRQAWNPLEVAAGGVVEQHPDAYVEVTDRQAGVSWLEHRLFFTTNPCLYRRSLLGAGWPDGPRSEGRLTARLLTDGTPEVAGDLVRFGYWGRRQDPPFVEHVGHQRIGVGY